MQNHFVTIYALVKKLALWADAFYESKCPSVCPSVCLSVCLCVHLFTFEVPFKRRGCPILLEIRNTWGKVRERSGLRFEHFCLEVVLNHQTKNSFFLADFACKKRWKPRFPMDQRPLVEGRIANCGIFLDFLSFCVLDDFFQFFKQFGF